MVIFFFVKQKTSYEMRISDWSSDVCSSDLLDIEVLPQPYHTQPMPTPRRCRESCSLNFSAAARQSRQAGRSASRQRGRPAEASSTWPVAVASPTRMALSARNSSGRSEEHTSELQSLMRISYAVFCLKKK